MGWRSKRAAPVFLASNEESEQEQERPKQERPEQQELAQDQPRSEQLEKQELTQDQATQDPPTSEQLEQNHSGQERPEPALLTQIHEGTAVLVRYRGRSKWFPGKIAKLNDNGTYDIRYDDGDSEKGVKADMVKLFEEQEHPLAALVKDLDLDDDVLGDPFDEVDELDLSEKNLAKIPEIVFTLPLKGLYLEGNQIKVLEDRIGELVSLEELYLRRNQLEELPTQLAHLRNLDSLYLEDNRLTTEGIPDSLDSLGGSLKVEAHVIFTSFLSTHCTIPACCHRIGRG